VNKRRTALTFMCFYRAESANAANMSVADVLGMHSTAAFRSATSDHHGRHEMLLLCAAR
jgi:hypothetical protein